MKKKHVLSKREKILWLNSDNIERIEKLNYRKYSKMYGQIISIKKSKKKFQPMSNIIDLNKTKKVRRLKQASVLKEIRTILKRLFAEDRRDKLIANKRKNTIKQVKYFFGRRVSQFVKKYLSWI